MVELRWEGKYTADGKKAAPVRLVLPFQDVETVNESAQTRNLMLDFSGLVSPLAASSPRPEEFCSWRTK
jgi:hypothetical protein